MNANGKDLKTLVQEYLRQDSPDRLRTYTGISETTWRRWRSGKVSPAGFYKVKTMHFLNKEGFTCTELASLPDQTRTLGLLISEGKIDPNKAAQSIGVSIDNMLSMLLGRRTCTFERLQKIDALTRSVHSSVEKDEAEKDGLIERLAKLFKEAEPLISRLLSGEFSPEDRAKLRTKVGELEFFKLSNAIDQLCGGKALLSK